MSNLLSTACRPLQMPPTAKAVLMAMADYADDSGRCWPSISGLCEYTCFGRSAVIEAIKVLERLGAVVADRSDRYRTTYLLTPANYSATGLVRQKNQSGRRTSTADGGLVRLADDEVRQPDDEVREPDTNHQEPSRTINKATTKVARKRADPAGPITSIKGVQVPERPDDVVPQTWADWLGLRKAKSAPVTVTVMADAQREAGKAGLTLTRFLEIWCTRGSQGLQADWIKPHERAGPASVTPIRPSAAANFQGKTYAGTAIEDLPPDLRDAARAALADG